MLKMASFSFTNSVSISSSSAPHIAAEDTVTAKNGNQTIHYRYDGQYATEGGAIWHPPLYRKPYASEIIYNVLRRQLLLSIRM